MERAFDPVETYKTPDFAPGQRLKDHLANEYIFVKATSAITGSDTARDVVVINADHGAAPITAARALPGRRAGVAVASIAQNSWGWVSIYGTGNVSVKAACGKDAKLYPSDAGGTVDDTLVADKAVLGLTLKTARGAADGVAPGYWAYPFVG